MMSCIRIRLRLVRNGHQHRVGVDILRRHNKYPRQFTGHADPDVGRSISSADAANHVLVVILDRDVESVVRIRITRVDFLVLGHM